MKNGLALYASFFLYVLLWIVAICISPQPTSAQTADCSTTTERRDFPVYIYDQRASVRYGPSSCGTVSPGANISRVSGISSTSFSCGNHSDEPEVSRAFVATLFRCSPGTAVFDVTAPPGFTCNNAAWRYYSTSGGFGSVDLGQPILGTGCRVTVPYPPNEWERQAIVTVNLPDPSFSAVCNGNGTATISWGNVSGASEYGWRLNNRANGWGNWTTDSYGFSTGNSAIVPITYGQSYEVNVTATNYAGRHPFASSWSPAFTCSPPAATYAINYNGNGNTSGSAPAAQTKTHNVTLTLRTNTGGLARTGFTFAGWDTAANGSGTDYAAGGAYTANSAATLYARWTAVAVPTATPVPTYQITYNGNGHTGGSIPAAQTKTYNVSLTLRTNSGNLVRSGYTFAGWSTTTDGSSGNYAAGGTYTANVGDVLYARWTPNTYSVTYNGNGNTAGTVPAAQTKTHAVSLTLRTNTGNLSRTGYTFVGWDTAANGSGTDYAAGGVYSANAAVVLYARWTINTYTVTPTSNANGTVTPSSRTVNHGSTTTFTITPNTGYSAAASGCGGSLSGTTYTTGPITGNCIVTATFTIISYTLTRTASPAAGGTFQCSTTSASSGFGNCAATYTHGTTVYVRANANTNYRFTGFTAGHGCTTVSTNVCTYAMTANRSITANFVLMPDLIPTTITRAPPSTSSSTSYTITYCNNGPGLGGTIFTIRVTNTQGLITTVTGTVPAPNGGCSTTTTPAVTCNSLGDTFGGTYCNENSTIIVELDITNTVIETNEGNNTSAATNFSAVASEPFYKLSNASLHRLQLIDIPMPAAGIIQAFDADDSTATQLDINAAGLVSSSGLIRINGGTVSANNFQRDTYSDGDTYLNNLTTFVNYANAQKPTNVIDVADPNPLSKIQSNTVNVFGTGTQTLNINAQPTASQTDFVLLVNGNVNLTVNPIYNTTADNSIAIIATGTITIANNVSTVNTILIGNSVILGTSATPLKINGNLISNTATTITRNRATNPDVQPNVFIVFNPKMYIDLLPHLSDITVEGRQVE